jgi:hypothetical protein
MPITRDRFSATARGGEPRPGSALILGALLLLTVP